MHSEFEIFIPKPENRITPNKITFVLYATCVIIFMISVINHCKPQIALFLFIIPFSVSIYFFIKKFWTYKFLDGELAGSLIISLDYIKIATQSFTINEIKKIDFHAINYYGKREDYRNNFNPILSQGTSNFVELFLNNGQKIKTYFKLNFKEHHKILYPFVVEMIKHGKISVLRGTEILGINDYDEIQEFKRNHLQ